MCLVKTDNGQGAVLGVKTNGPARALCGLAAVMSLGVGVSAASAAIVIHQYDFEPAASTPAAGWTHIDPSTAAGATQAGFILTETLHMTAATRGSSSPEAPAEVTKDLIIFESPTGAAVGTIVGAFQEIVPAHATSVTVTIYRNDPSDAYTPYNTSTWLSLNGGTETRVDYHYWNGTDFYHNHAPIVAMLPISEAAEPGTLVVRMRDEDAGASTNLRVAGVVFEYTVVPEPSGLAAVAALSGMVLARRRRRQLRGM